MAKNAEKSPQVKSRQTKLSKKSNEELIEIILRKDACEKNLNSQILNLKAEVNSLNERINNAYTDMEGTEQELKKAKELSEYSNNLLKEEVRKGITLLNKVMLYKFGFYVSMAITAVIAMLWVIM